MVFALARPLDDEQSLPCWHTLRLVLFRCVSLAVSLLFRPTCASPPPQGFSPPFPRLSPPRSPYATQVSSRAFPLVGGSRPLLLRNYFSNLLAWTYFQRYTVNPGSAIPQRTEATCRYISRESFHQTHKTLVDSIPVPICVLVSEADAISTCTSELLLLSLLAHL